MVSDPTLIAPINPWNGRPQADVEREAFLYGRRAFHAGRYRVLGLAISQRERANFFAGWDDAQREQASNRHAALGELCGLLECVSRLSAASPTLLRMYDVLSRLSSSLAPTAQPRPPAVP